MEQMEKDAQPPKEHDVIIWNAAIETAAKKANSLDGDMVTQIVYEIRKLKK